LFSKSLKSFRTTCLFSEDIFASFGQEDSITAVQRWEEFATRVVVSM
jgi:hypothetical protein